MSGSLRLGQIPLQKVSSSLLPDRLSWLRGLRTGCGEKARRSQFETQTPTQCVCTQEWDAVFYTVPGSTFLKKDFIYFS